MSDIATRLANAIHTFVKNMIIEGSSSGDAADALVDLQGLLQEAFVKTNPKTPSHCVDVRLTKPQVERLIACAVETVNGLRAEDRERGNNENHVDITTLTRAIITLQEALHGG